MPKIIQIAFRPSDSRMYVLYDSGRMFYECYGQWVEDVPEIDLALLEPETGK